ncbi:MAG: hypothetical protein FJW83_02030 [Actinobacteria bacterium]|nr:hypothetical protein [Actinomycetota bacterium]
MSGHTPVERTYAERHAAAHDVLSTLVPGLDPEKATAGMARRYGALGSFAQDFVLGDLWSRPQLSRRDRSMIVIAFLATLGSEEELFLHCKGGLNHGLTRTEIDEILLHVATYAGFPTALPAARVWDRVQNELDGVDRRPPKTPAASKSDAERRAAAYDVLVGLTGGRVDPDPAVARANLVDRLGAVGELAHDWAFGEVWARDELSRRDRSMVVCAILAMLGRHDEFRVHVPGALQHGCTATEVEEIMVQLVVYGGFPRAVEAFTHARACIARATAG